jgi:hypothetical protein
VKQNSPEIKITWDYDPIYDYFICTGVLKDGEEKYGYSLRVTSMVYSIDQNKAKEIAEEQVRYWLLNRTKIIAEQITNTNFWDELSKL